MEASNSIDKSFFGGRVILKSLVVTDQPATRKEIRARIASPKGELAVLTEVDQTIRHLAYVELLPGQLRGDHYHKLRHEYFYVIAGEATARFQDVATGELADVQIVGGDLVFIRPGIAHAFVPRSSGHGIEFAAESFDLEDVYRHPVPDRNK